MRHISLIQTPISMRIGIEAQRLFRPKKHGVEIVILEIIKRLQIIDNENQYFIYVRKDIDVCLSSTKNFTIRELKACSFPIWEQYTLPLAAKKDKCELLHCSCNTAPLFINIPLVVTLHDVIYLEKNYSSILFGKGTMYQRLGNVYRHFVVPKIFNKCKKVITVSNYEKTAIDTRLSKGISKVEVVHNAVSDRFFNPNFVDFPNLPKRFLLFLGNTDPKKNTSRVLLSYFVFLEKFKIDIELVVTDLSYDFIRSVAQKNDYTRFLPRIHAVGYVPNIQMPWLYSQCELFLCPSVRESFGLPVLEAMACGVPVLTSNNSSLPEVAGDAAYMVSPNNPEEIAEGIAQILLNSEVKTMLVARGFENVKRFSWNNSAIKIAEIYSSIL